MSKKTDELLEEILLELQDIRQALEDQNEPLIETVEEEKAKNPPIFPVTPQGYHCVRCNTWVPHGTIHYCTYRPPNQPWQPWSPYTGWRCSRCGTWVGTHQYHNCGGSTGPNWVGGGGSPNQCGGGSSSVTATGGTTITWNVT